MNLINVTFVNLYTRSYLAQARVHELPMSGDAVFLDDRGYDVVRCEWYLVDDEDIKILVLVEPQIDAKGERPLSYPSV